MVASSSLAFQLKLGQELERRFRQDLVGARDSGGFGNDSRTVEHDAHCITGSTQIE